MMLCMGFPEKFAHMIYECIFIATFSIPLDGSPVGYLDSNRGITQGDPLSPFLFAVAMEYFKILLDMEFYEGNITPVFSIKPTLVHLLYADGTLVFSKANIKRMKASQTSFT